jgi:hypothetical protein
LRKCQGIFLVGWVLEDKLEVCVGIRKVAGKLIPAVIAVHILNAMRKL